MGMFDFIAAPIGDFLGDLTGSNNANKALDQSAEAIRDQTKLAGRVYDESVARQQPFYQSGVRANSARDRLLYGGYDMNQSPAAQYALTQGNKSLNRQLAARGLLGSGSAAQRFAELSSGIAASDYNSQWDRLSGVINGGTGAANSQNNAGANFTSAGNAAMNATMGNNNARAQLYTGTSPLKVGADIAGSIGMLRGL